MREKRWSEEVEDDGKRRGGRECVEGILRKGDHFDSQNGNEGWETENAIVIRPDLHHKTCHLVDYWPLLSKVI